MKILIFPATWMGIGWTCLLIFVYGKFTKVGWIIGNLVIVAAWERERLIRVPVRSPPDCDFIVVMACK